MLRKETVLQATIESFEGQFSGFRLIISPLSVKYSRGEYGVEFEAKGIP
jgi:hypothetical protein